MLRTTGVGKAHATAEDGITLKLEPEGIHCSGANVATKEEADSLWLDPTSPLNIPNSPKPPINVPASLDTDKDVELELDRMWFGRII